MTSKIQSLYGGLWSVWEATDGTGGGRVDMSSGRSVAMDLQTSNYSIAIHQRTVHTIVHPFKALHSYAVKTLSITHPTVTS